MTREEAIKELTLHLVHWKRLKNEHIVATDECNNTINALRMAIEALEQESVKTLKQIPKACKNCSNHPSNGGSGVCFCTLGSTAITC